MYSIGADDDLTQPDSELDNNLADDNSSDVDSIDEPFWIAYSKHKSRRKETPS